MYYSNVALIIICALFALFVVDRHYNSGLVFMFRKRKTSPAYKLVDMLVFNSLSDGDQHFLEDLFVKIYPLCPKLYRNNQYFFEHVFNDVINDRVEISSYRLVQPYEDAVCLSNIT